MGVALRRRADGGVRRPAPSGLDRVLVAFNRGARDLAAPARSRARLSSGASRIDTSDDDAATRRPNSPTARRSPARSVLIVAETPVSADGRARRSRRARRRRARATRRASPPEWWDVDRHAHDGRRRRPSSRCSTASACRRARRRSRANCSTGLMEETRARALPPSLDAVARQSAARDPARRPSRAAGADRISRDLRTARRCPGRRRAPTRAASRCRTAARSTSAISICRRCRSAAIGWKSAASPARSRSRRRRPIGPKACGGRGSASRAQLYALRRDEGDQGIGDFTALGARRRGRGAARRRLFRRQPDARAVPRRPRAGRAPTIPPTGASSIRSSSTRSAATACRRREWTRRRRDARRAARRRRASSPPVDYDAVWRVKRIALQYRFAAFVRARAARPDDPLFAEFDAFVARRAARALSRFAVFEAIQRERNGEYWRHWPAELRDADPPRSPPRRRSATTTCASRCSANGSPTGNSPPPPSARATAGLEIGLYRDLAVGSAPDGAESWSRADELGIGATVGAPPDPFSPNGPELAPAAARPGRRRATGWKGFRDLLAANMRHAGMLRIDHAMGLTRLFVIPDGAKPAEGAYVAYPVDDLIGQITLESQRHRCMVVGEDLGTVPEGFREKLTPGQYLRHARALVRARRRRIHRPAGISRRTASPAPRPTICRRSPAGGGRRHRRAHEPGPARPRPAAQRARPSGSAEKDALVDALMAAGRLAEAPALDAPLDDSLAGAVHALIAHAGSVLGHRPGRRSRRRDGGDQSARHRPRASELAPSQPRRRRPIFETPRAQAILAALGALRPRAP